MNSHAILNADPGRKRAALRFACLAALTKESDRFVTARMRDLCKNYMEARLIPKLLAPDMPLSAPVALGLAHLTIEGFIAADRKRALI